MMSSALMLLSIPASNQKRVASSPVCLLLAKWERAANPPEVITQSDDRAICLSVQALTWKASLNEADRLLTS
jgi:hypothetical protein